MFGSYYNFLEKKSLKNNCKLYKMYECSGCEIKINWISDRYSKNAKNFRSNQVVAVKLIFKMNIINEDLNLS